MANIWNQCLDSSKESLIWVGGKLKEKVWTPVVEVLKSGITPHKLALSLAFGIPCGLFPIPGTTALLCLGSALVLKLNLIILQIINLVLTPIELMCIPLFYKFGHSIINSDAEPHSPSEFISQIKSHFFEGLKSGKDIILEAIVGWLIFTPICCLVVYGVSYPLLKYFLPKIQAMTGRNDGVDVEELMLVGDEYSESDDDFDLDLLDYDQNEVESQSRLSRRDSSDTDDFVNPGSNHRLSFAPDSDEEFFT